MDDYAEKDHWSLALTYGGSDGRNLDWMLRYFIGEDNRESYDPAGSDPSLWGFDDGGEPAIAKADQIGAQGQMSLNLDISSITVGFDWLNYDLQNTYTPKNSEYENLAGFILGKLRLFNKKLKTYSDRRCSPRPL